VPTSFALPQINGDERMLWIHAGPHKAASSYVTERLRKNRSALATQRVLMDGDNNLLANSIAEKNYQPLEQALSGLPSDFHRILISSSSLDTRILKRSVLNILRDMASSHGFKLGISYFIRDQQSWLNSVYCHRVRRFRSTQNFPDYCRYIMNNPSSWDISYPSKFSPLKDYPEIVKMFLPLSRCVEITDPFIALTSALGLKEPSIKGWLKGEPSKKNIQPGAKGIWMSRICYQLMESLGFDPDVLNRKGKVIRDLAIERGWDQEKFDGFDQPLLDQVTGFYASSNDAFSREHWGVSWNDFFPVKAASQFVYSGPESEQEKKEMRRLMVRVLRELHFPWPLRKRFFKGYDSIVAG
jgi:hypothetical protein